MTCGDPTTDAKGPCNFSSSSTGSTTSCYDSATTSDGAGYSLSCSGTECQCTKTGNGGTVTSTLELTAAEACETATTLRTALMDECIGAGSACGAGCPADLPDNGQPCDDTEINLCYYSTATASNYCYCMGGEFLCQ
jgi:hypothetical protein